MIEPAKIVGGNGDRNKLDFYPTPRDATQALCDWLKQNGISGRKVWECACGENDMVNVLEENGFDVIGTDIQTGTNFLTAEKPFGVEWIITNPPFSIAEAFIKKAATHGVPFAFLLKCQYWHSARRKALFDKIRPSHILPLTWRPDFTGKGASMLDVMWVVWGLQKTIYEPLSRPEGRR